jgi:hypothetical protein
LNGTGSAAETLSIYILFCLLKKSGKKWRWDRNSKTAAVYHRPCLDERIGEKNTVSEFL